MVQIIYNIYTFHHKLHISTAEQWFVHLAFEHVSLYIQKHLSIVTTNGAVRILHSENTFAGHCRLYGKHWKMSAIINLTKELPQSTAVIQSEHTDQYLKSSNEQRHLEAVYDIRGATCISDAVFVLAMIQIWLQWLSIWTLLWSGSPRLIMWGRSFAVRHQNDAYPMQCTTTTKKQCNKMDNVFSGNLDWTHINFFGRLWGKLRFFPYFWTQFWNNAQLSFCKGCHARFKIKQNNNVATV